jgi:GNAT superfamily N-acetyltransferase
LIRRAEQRDAPAVAQVYIASRRGAVRYLPSIHTDEDMRAWIANYLVPNLEVWVAELDGTIVAMMALEHDYLDQLYVAPANQRRGVGDLLLAKAKERSPQRLRLYTFQRNAPARRFYERRGFVAIELSDGARNEEREPDVLYECIGAAPARA